MLVCCGLFSLLFQKERAVFLYLAIVGHNLLQSVTAEDKM